MKTAFLLCVAILSFSCTLHAQNCISSAPAGADDCAKACTYCSLDGKTGSTAAYTSGPAPGFCASADNDQWYGFIAGADSIVIQVTPAGCQNGNGIEVALYAACDAPPLACAAGQAGEGTAPRILEAALEPGQTYFLMIDGFDGDVCNFSIQTSPPDAVATPAIDLPGPVEGPSIVAAGSTHIYRIPPVANASAYTWTAPSGTKINGQTPFVTLPAPGGHQITVTYGSNQSGKICVKPVTPCGAGASSCLSVSTNGTLPPPCPAAGFPATDLCADVCAYCDFDGYTGATTGYTGQTPPGFCGTIENEQWLGFVAGAPAATITVTPSNCVVGNGVQIALYPSCGDVPLQCNSGSAGGGNTPLSVTSALIPGVTYYLLIDGWAGDQCDFQVTVSPPGAGIAPVVGPTGILNGPSTVCPGARATFSVPPVSGASAYLWDAQAGWLINGMPAPVTLVGAGANNVQVTVGAGVGNTSICVQPVNSCSAGVPVCRNVAVQPIPPTVLPRVVACAEDIPYLLPWGQEVFSSGTYEYTYPSYLGCDSLVRQQVVVKAPLLTFLAPRTICTGDSVVVCGEAFKTGGSYMKQCQSFQGCDSIVNFSIVLLEPLAEILPHAVDCAAPPVTLFATASPGTKIWKDENGQVVGTGNMLEVDTPGMYFLEVTVSAGGNFCTAVDTAVVRFGSTIPESGAAVSGSLTCTQKTVTLDGSTNIANAQFQWSGPGGFSSALEDPVVEIPGEYVLTVTDPESGCSSQATVEAPADTEAPIIQLNSQTLSCNTPEVQIECQVSVQDGLFSWTGPGAFSSVEQQPFTGMPGTYFVTVTNPGNGCTATAEITVTGDLLQAAVSVEGGTLTCMTNTILLTCNTDVTSPIFSWQGPGGFVSLAQNPEVGEPGLYAVTVSGGNGCTGAASVTVLQDTVSPAASLLVDTITCLTDSVFIGVADPDGYHFAWAGPNGFASDEAGFHIALSELGIYSVTITNPSNGCTQTLQVSEFIQNQVAPGVVALSVVNDQFGQQIGAIDIQITYPGSTTITWYKNGSPYAVSEDISGLAAGIYTVVVTADDNGCSATLMVEVINITVSTGAAPGAGTYWDLFPNPAHSYLHLRYRGGGVQPEARVSIIDVTGRHVLLQTVLTSASAGIPVGHLPPGMYRLQIQTEKTTVQKAVAIQH